MGRDTNGLGTPSTTTLVIYITSVRRAGVRVKKTVRVRESGCEISCSRKATTSRIDGWGGTVLEGNSSQTPQIPSDLAIDVTTDIRVSSLRS